MPPGQLLKSRGQTCQSPTLTPGLNGIRQAVDSCKVQLSEFTLPLIDRFHSEFIQTYMYLGLVHIKDRKLTFIDLKHGNWWKKEMFRRTFYCLFLPLFSQPIFCIKTKDWSITKNKAYFIQLGCNWTKTGKMAGMFMSKCCPWQIILALYRYLCNNVKFGFIKLGILLRYHENWIQW